MTRGNQRELARAKNMKKQQGGKTKPKDGKDGGQSLTDRRERDAEVMRQKQQKAKDAGASGASGGS